jgi:hypothetical protein
MGGTLAETRTGVSSVRRGRGNLALKEFRKPSDKEEERFSARMNSDTNEKKQGLAYW